MAELPGGTVTFLFTDIEGSTTPWEHQPEAMRAALVRHDALLRATISEHGGHVVKTMGDAFHAVFSRAPDAVAAALEGQRRLQAEPWGRSARSWCGWRPTPLRPKSGMATITVHP
jgi:class 3 adenylate cyclase